MRQIVIIILLMLGTVAASAQRSLSGTVCDEKGTPMPGVIVKVLATDSDRILAYKTTDANGRYAMDIKQEVQEVRVQFALMGYEQQVVRTKTLGDMGRTVMKEGEMQLKEVTVKAPTVRQRSDTISYNVAQVKDNGDRTIEDVIRRIPGIEVDATGIIKYNGKPINKFYIEGNDMLGGQYTLASKNIRADDIATVDVYRQHQPVKVLKGVKISEQAALNLKMKSNRMLKPIGQAAGGIGYDDELKAEVDVFGLLVAPKDQALITLKGNNMGIFYDSEVTQKTGNEVSSQRPYSNGILQPLMKRSATGYDKRSTLNRGAMASGNMLHRLSDDVVMTLNTGYHYVDGREHRARQTTYWRGEGMQSLVVDEDFRGHTTSHEAWLTARMELNSSQRYIADELQAEGAINTARDNIQDTRWMAQRISLADYRVRNRLSTTWRRKNRIYSFNSTVSVAGNPRSDLTVSMPLQDSVAVTQGMDGMKFQTYEETSYQWLLGQNSTLSMNASFQSDVDRVEAGQQTGATLIRYRGYRLYTSVYPAYQYKYGTFYVKLSLPLQMMDMHYRDCTEGERYDYDRPMLGGRVTVGWRLKNRLRLTAEGGTNRRWGGMTSVMTHPLWVDYRSYRMLGTGLLEHRQNYTGSANISYSNILEGVNASLVLGYSRSRGNVVSGSNVSAGQSAMQMLRHRNVMDTYTATASVSRNVFDLHTTFSLDAGLSGLHTQMLRQGSVRSVGTCSYTLEGKMHSMLWNQHVVADLGCRYVLGTQHMGQGEVTNLQHEITPHARVSVFPISHFEIYARADGSISRTEASRDRNLYVDAGVQYTFQRLALELNATNLTNRRSHTTRQFVLLDSYSTVSYLRPVCVVAMVRWLF